MKTNHSRNRRNPHPTLAELVATLDQLTHNEQLTAFIVADMVNSRLVQLGGLFRGKRVIIA